MEENVLGVTEIGVHRGIPCRIRFHVCRRHAAVRYVRRFRILPADDLRLHRYRSPADHAYLRGRTQNPHRAAPSDGADLDYIDDHGKIPRRVHHVRRHRSRQLPLLPAPLRLR